MQDFYWELTGSNIRFIFIIKHTNNPSVRNTLCDSVQENHSRIVLQRRCNQWILRRRHSYVRPLFGCSGDLGWIYGFNKLIGEMITLCNCLVSCEGFFFGLKTNWEQESFIWSSQSNWMFVSFEWSFQSTSFVSKDGKTSGGFVFLFTVLLWILVILFSSLITSSCKPVPSDTIIKWISQWVFLHRGNTTVTSVKHSIFHPLISVNVLGAARWTNEVQELKVRL